jgi:phospholipase C
MELSHGQLAVSMSNRGSATLQLSVYAHHALGDTAQRFDINANGSATTSVTPEVLTGAYDVEIHGPNGFLRHAAGSVLSPESGVEATLDLQGGNGNPKLKLTLRNGSGQRQTVRVSGLHNVAHTFDLGSHGVEHVDLDPVGRNHGWYDLLVSVAGHPGFSRRFAGHLENGDPSRTGPE